MENKKNKILFISSWYPNRNAPTYGIFVKRHAQAVSLSNNLAVLYVCSDNNLSNKKYDITENKEDNVYTIIVYYKKVTVFIPLISHFIKAIRYFKAYRLGYQKIKNHYGKPDLVHANILFPSGIIALYLKWFYKVPYLVTENWTGYLPSDGSYKGFFRKLITKSIAVNANYLTPVSLDLQKAMQDHGFRSNYEIVPNVVDVNLFYPEKNLPTGQAGKSRKEKKRMIHVSAMDDPQKNISGIIRVIKKVAEKRNDFELFIVGDGEYKSSLETLAQQLGLLNKIIFFKGLKLKEELAQLIRRSDFFVLFSNYENLPCVVLESLASGLPVIVTRIGGTPEHISGKMGIIVEPKDEASLEKAIHHMLDHYSEYDPEYLRAYATKKFSYESVAEQFNKIYDKMIK